MDKGSYRGRRVNFASYAVSYFNPYLFSDPVRAQMGCGACALALITGSLPEFISKNGKSHFSDAFMVRFLRKKGYSVLRLTLCNLSVGGSKIGRQHVILLSQLLMKNEGTWGVIYDGLYYHNSASYALNALSFLNRPILSAYLVSHPRWGFRPRLRDDDSPRVKRDDERKDRLTFSHIFSRTRKSKLTGDAIWSGVGRAKSLL